MLWESKEFPIMVYKMNKFEGSAPEMMQAHPRWVRAAFKVLTSLQSVGLFVPKSLSKVKDMKKVQRYPFFRTVGAERSGVLEYLEGVSRADEHYFRVYENSDCMGFENIGVPIASHVPPMLAGYCKAIERSGQDWNAVETKCLGLGDPYCEFKVVRGDIDDLKGSLEMDSSLIEKIHQRLMEQLMGFLLDGKPLVNRPGLGKDVHLHVVVHGMGFLNLAGERYRMAQRMGAARTANKIGESLLKAGLSEDETIKRVLDFMNYCRVGKVTLGETVRIIENCENLRTTLFKHREEPSCFFTTGFLNGLFSSVKNKHVREIRCVAAGDPYCEWEII